MQEFSENKQDWVMPTPKSAARLTRETMERLRMLEPGDKVSLKAHVGGAANDADIKTRDFMEKKAKSLFGPGALFVSEDHDDPDAIECPTADDEGLVILADPCDGSRQKKQLEFGYASAALFCTSSPDRWWRVAAASVATSTEKVTTFCRGREHGDAGNEDDEARPIAPCIAIGASSGSKLGLLPLLGSVRDPKVELDSRDEDPYLRVWNTAGNPLTAGLMRSRTMVAVQPSWSTQWDTLFALLGAYSGLQVRSLVGGKTFDAFDLRVLWGRPRWHEVDRTCIPPLVVGPKGSYTDEVFDIVRNSGLITTKRPSKSEAHRKEFKRRMDRDSAALLEAIRYETKHLGHQE